MNAFNFLTSKRESASGTGITMMLDKGMGLLAVRDFLEISGKFVSLAKFGWGTSALHEMSLIRDKAATYTSYGVIPYPGGTLFEIAYIQNKVTEFLEESRLLGFQAIEISDGTVKIPSEDREQLIGQVKDHDFLVITEVGKKDPIKDHQISVEERAILVNRDLDYGADLVLVEAREGGKNIGFYDDSGKVKEDELDNFIKDVETDKLIWEAPQKDQQVYMILKFGANVNLGNIAPEEVTSLESMRMGLRGDTLGKVNLQ